MTNRKNLQKSLAIILSVVMILSLLPVMSVNAASKTYTIVYNANGGDVFMPNTYMPNTIVTYGVETNLRANKYKRLEYSFSGWHAYRSSDKKWFCQKKNDSSKTAWLTEKQLSKDNSYKKFLYSNKAKVSKTSSVNHDVVTMYAQWKKLKSIRKSDHIHYALLMNDHGWTGVDIYYSVTESYSVSGSNVTFENRHLYAYALFGRPKWDNPYNFQCSNIWHEDKSGHILKKFKMYDVACSIFPAVGNAKSISTTETESFKHVTYSKDNKYKGAFNLNITAQYCLNPFAKTIKYSLNRK